MSVLSVACIVVGALYLLTRFPLTIAPRKTAKFYRFIISTNTNTRIFIIIWLIPWCVALYSSVHSTIETSRIILVWSLLGILISFYVIIFASRYRRQTNKNLDSMSSVEGNWWLRIFCLLTTFAGVFLVYLGINVF
jgi:hypothetical protein